MLSFFIYILSLTALAAGLANQDAEDTTISTSSTLAWVTLTTNGVITTSSFFYSQEFISTYTAATGTVSSAEVGMGSLSGSVGGVRTYDQTTVSENEGVAGFQGYGGFGGVMLAVLGAMV